MPLPSETLDEYLLASIKMERRVIDAAERREAFVRFDRLRTMLGKRAVELTNFRGAEFDTPHGKHRVEELNYQFTSEDGRYLWAVMYAIHLDGVFQDLDLVVEAHSAEGYALRSVAYTADNEEVRKSTRNLPLDSIVRHFSAVEEVAIITHLEAQGAEKLVENEGENMRLEKDMGYGSYPVGLDEVRVLQNVLVRATPAPSRPRLL